MSQTFLKSQTPQGTQAFSSRGNRNLFNSTNFSPASSTFQDVGGSQNIRTVNPFVTNPHAHPSFTPVKLGGKGTVDSRLCKQPKPPDKPLMPYMRYSRKVSRLVWDSIKASNPDLKLWEIGKIIGQMWRELSNSEKQEYIDEYEIEKAQYNELMKVYHSSAAYQAWIVSKGKVDAEVEADEPEKTASRRSKVPQHKEVAETRIITSMPTNEEEDDMEDAFSTKNVAAARYYRNHCLINDIFSDVVVPDGRSVINEARMNTLKKQVNSLTMHQKKLEGELEQIEERHRFKKQKLAESSELFNTELDKLNKMGPVITKEMFDQMVEKAKDDIINKSKVEEKPVGVPQVMTEEATTDSNSQLSTIEQKINLEVSDGASSKKELSVDEEPSTPPPILTPIITPSEEQMEQLGDIKALPITEEEMGSKMGIITSPISDVQNTSETEACDKMDVEDGI